MYTTSKKITNNDAKNIISGQDVILVDDSSINAYTDSTNYYNAAKSVIKMNQKETYLHV
ncbi:MAG: hypothetical protein ACLUNP_07805 [Ruminococcus sp.]